MLMGFGHPATAATAASPRGYNPVVDILIVGQSNAIKFGNDWIAAAPGVTQWTTDRWAPATSPGVVALGTLLAASLGEEV
jgi:hypothetical protein